MWNTLQTPKGMNRRHFVSHMMGASALAGSSLAFGRSLQAHAEELRRGQKSAILLLDGWWTGNHRYMGSQAELIEWRPLQAYQDLR